MWVHLNLTSPPPPSLAHSPIPVYDIDRPRSGQSPWPPCVGPQVWVQQACVPLNLPLPQSLRPLAYPCGYDIDRPGQVRESLASLDLRCGSSKHVFPLTPPLPLPWPPCIGGPQVWVQQACVQLNLTPPPSLAHSPIPVYDIDRPRSGQRVPGLPALVDLRCGSSKHVFPLTSPLPLPSPTSLSVAVILIGPGQVRESLASLVWWTSGVGPASMCSP